MIILIILGYILLLLLLIVITVLVIPIEYLVSGQKYDNASISAEIFWFFKGIHVRFYKKDSKNHEFSFKILGLNLKPGEKKKTKDNKMHVKKKKKEGKDAGRFFNRDFIEQILRAVKDILGHLKPELFYAEGLYGFDDPYHTGIACALINSLMPYSEGFKIKLTPIFDEEILKGKFIIKGKVILGVLVYIAVRFFLSSAVRRTFRKKAVHASQGVI